MVLQEQIIDVNHSIASKAARILEEFFGATPHPSDGSSDGSPGGSTGGSEDMMDDAPEKPDPLADALGEQLGEMDMHGGDSDPEMEGGLAALVGKMGLGKRGGQDPGRGAKLAGGAAGGAPDIA